VLRAWDDHLAHPALPQVLAAELRSAGFTEVDVRGHAFVAAEYAADAYGVAAIPLVERYVAAHDAIGNDVAAAWAAEQRRLGDLGRFYFTCVQVAFVGTRPSG
jgi:hypothetical protein